MTDDKTLREAKDSLDKLTNTLISASEEINSELESQWRVGREEALEMLRADLEDMCYFIMGADRDISEAEEDMFDRLFDEFGIAARRTESSRRDIKELASVIKRGMPRTLAIFCGAAKAKGGSGSVPSDDTDRMFTEALTCYIKLMCHIIAADGEVAKKEVGALTDYVEGLCLSASAQTGLKINFKEEYVDLAVSLLS